jgi:hypothetical protein
MLGDEKQFFKIVVVQSRQLCVDWLSQTFN